MLPKGWELFAVLVVVLLLFGPKQLPKLGKMFGKTVKEVRSGMDSLNDELDPAEEKDKKKDEDSSVEEEKKDTDA